MVLPQTLISTIRVPGGTIVDDAQYVNINFNGPHLAIHGEAVVQSFRRLRRCGVQIVLYQHKLPRVKLKYRSLLVIPVFLR